MVVPGDQNGETRALTPPADLPVHLKAPGKRRGEALAEALALNRLRQEELGAQEEPPAAGV